jgi:hypothetical protein
VSKSRSGKCLCGAVSVTIAAEVSHFDVCHCGMCRKWSGGPALCVDGGKSVTIQGDESVTVFASSDWAERGFCKRCGTHLFYRLKNGAFTNVPLGVLDRTDDMTMTVQIFTDRKPGHYAFANQTKMMTEADVMAAFQAPQT